MLRLYILWKQLPLQAVIDFRKNAKRCSANSTHFNKLLAFSSYRKYIITENNSILFYLIQRLQRAWRKEMSRLSVAS
jgi:hypothetical protein